MTVTDDIKARIDIVSYIERTISLKKAGKYYKGLCPFHNEKTPSFVVYPDRQRWHCFGGCSEGGDLFSFYERQHNVTFKDALKALAEEAGVELPTYTKKLSDDQQRHLDILDDLATRYHKLLTEYDGAEQVRAYLASRGIAPDTITHWRLGYAPKQNIIKQLLSKYSADDLEVLGVIYTNDHGQQRCRFWNRLMIPITNGAGQIVGFGARKLDDGKSAKYINSHESDIFHKSHLLYGWHTARKQAQWDSQLVIVEGYMDVMQAHQAGYANVVAQMGTALTEQQIKLITDTNIQTIIVCLDGDEAGEQATARTVDTLIAHADQKDIRIVQLPAGQDPDDIIQLGQWEQTINSAVPVIDYLIHTAITKLPEKPSLGQKHEVANQLIPKLHKLEDSSKLWSIQKLASAVGLNPMALVDMANKLMSAKQDKLQPDVQPEIHDNTIEGYIIRCLLEEHVSYWYDLVALFSKFNLPTLTRNDFETHGGVYQQIIDIMDVAIDDTPLDHLDLDPVSFSSDTPDKHDFLLNCMYLRLNQTQRTMDILLELQQIEQFTAFLGKRQHLTQIISQIS